MSIEKSKNIRVVTIGSDRNIFDPSSGIAKRVIEYGELFGETHIIVFALAVLGLEPIQLSSNVWVYPSNSTNKLKYLIDANKMGKSIISTLFYGQTVLSTQDPFESGIAGVMLKKHFKIPLQMQVHTDLFNKYFLNHNILNFFRAIIARTILRYADGVRVVSKKVKNDIVSIAKIAEEKITVLPIFVDILKIIDYPISVNLKIKYLKWKKIILVVSRLEGEKNISLAIRAFKKTAKEYPDTGMVIVGKGSLEEKLKREVKKMHLENNVAFESWQQDVSSYYKTSYLFLNTSTYEGYGMTIVEAAACGTNILSSDVGVVPELIEDGKNGFICPVNDLKCFENKLFNAIANPMRMGERIFGDVKKYAVPKDEYLSKYKEAIVSLLKIE
jgi:glycosyltransferase involved in cell wall biosynthesis